MVGLGVRTGNRQPSPQRPDLRREPLGLRQPKLRGQRGSERIGRRSSHGRVPEQHHHHRQPARRGWRGRNRHHRLVRNQQHRPARQQQHSREHWAGAEHGVRAPDPGGHGGSRPLDVAPWLGVGQHPGQPEHHGEYRPGVPRARRRPQRYDPRARLRQELQLRHPPQVSAAALLHISHPPNWTQSSFAECNPTATPATNC